MAIDIDQSHYNTGTASVAGAVVTGIGTSFTVLRKGDLYGTHRGAGVRIASIEDDTHMTLAYDVPALYQANGPYEVQRTPYDIGYLAAIEDLIRTYGIGPLPALAELDGTGGDKGITLTGAGSAETFEQKAWARAMQGLTGAANKFPYLVDGNTAALADLTAKARELVGLNDESSMRDFLSLRFPLVATVNLYVDTSGNDINPGTLASPLKTISAAFGKALSYDLRRFRVRINVADGTYNENVQGYGNLLWCSQAEAIGIEVVGNIATPANVVLNGGFYARFGMRYSVAGFKIQSAEAGISAISASGFGSRIEATFIDFGQMSADGDHLAASIGGSFLMTGPYTISGGAQNHFHVTENSDGRALGVATIPNNITFVGNFAGVAGSELNIIGWSFNGAGVVTGSRFLAHYGGVIRTSTDSPYILPGSTMGAMQSGGMYGLGMSFKGCRAAGDHFVVPGTSSGTWIQVPLTVAARNTGSGFTTAGGGIFRALGGPITLSAKATINGAKSAGRLWGVAIYKNGASFDEAIGEQSATTEPQTLAFTSIDIATRDDLYQLFVRCDGPADKQVNGNPAWTSLQGEQRG